jgi:cytochrome oxidase assembly protein ShyY1
MLRLALTPRWLGGLLLLLVVVTATVLLGRWQWDRTQEILGAERASVAAPTSITDVLPAGGPADQLPAEATGRSVIATGRYEPGMQVAVTQRELDGRAGVWIVTGLRLADGRVLPVMRGWLPTADDAAAAVPTGDVTVTAVLQPDETFYAGASTAGGTIAAIAHPVLAQQWGVSPLPGYAVLVSEEPAATSAPAIVPVAPGDPSVPFPLQNFFYAFEWWIFGAFAIVVYVRWLWLEAGREEEQPVA